MLLVIVHVPYNLYECKIQFLIYQQTDLKNQICFLMLQHTELKDKRTTKKHED